MLIPSRAQCLALMERVEMPAHIRMHSFTVAGVAHHLAIHLNGSCPGLNILLVEAGALLHDIGKGRSLITGENHARLGGAMLREWGYEVVAPIVEEHIHIHDSDLASPLTESIIVNYADKRVRHDEIVSLEERFKDLIERYAKTREHRVLLQKKLELFLRLEEKMFDRLSIEPAELVHVTIEIDRDHSKKRGQEPWEARS